MVDTASCCPAEANTAGKSTVPQPYMARISAMYFVAALDEKGRRMDARELQTSDAVTAEGEAVQDWETKQLQDNRLASVHFQLEVRLCGHVCMCSKSASQAELACLAGCSSGRCACLLSRKYACCGDVPLGTQQQLLCPSLYMRWLGAQVCLTSRVSTLSCTQLWPNTQLLDSLLET